MKVSIILCSAYLFLAFVAFKYVNEKLGLTDGSLAASRSWAQRKTVEAQSLDNALTLAENVPAKAEFSKRCSRPEVVRCFGFDNQAQTDPYIYPPSWQRVKRARVVQDVRASGNGSLRFEIPSGSGANTSGSFWLNFSDSLKIQFGRRSRNFTCSGCKDSHKNSWAPLIETARDGNRRLLAPGINPASIILLALTWKWLFKILISAVLLSCIIPAVALLPIAAMIHSNRIMRPTIGSFKTQGSHRTVFIRRQPVRPIFHPTETVLDMSQMNG